jgi:flagellar hook-associated protein 3 FlgL
MRISTQLMYDSGINAIRRQQSDLYKTQQQLSTGRRTLTPSDDPVASARAVSVSQAKAGHEQFARNIEGATNSLAQTESILGEVSSILIDAKASAISGANGSLRDADRISLAKELRGKFEQLLSLANSQDGAGSHLFSGYSEATQAFSGALGNVSYNGDDGEREIQVSASRRVPVSLSGATVFRDIKSGNGVFESAAASANTGTGVIGGGRVLNPAAWNGDSYEVRFSVSSGTTTYDIVNTSSGATLSSGNAYASGGSISFAGVQVEIKGDPANGDRFSVAPSRNQSVFEAFNNLIVALEAPVVGEAAKAQLQNSLNRGFADLDQSAERVLSVRTQVGSSQKEIDQLGSINEAQKVLRESELAQLQDVDYAKAISDYTRQMTALEAAQRTYASVTKLSLFNFL